jgi:hypothetical protein
METPSRIEKHTRTVPEITQNVLLYAMEFSTFVINGCYCTSMRVPGLRADVLRNGRWKWKSRSQWPTDRKSSCDSEHHKRVYQESRPTLLGTLCHKPVVRQSISISAWCLTPIRNDMEDDSKDIGEETWTNLHTFPFNGIRGSFSNDFHKL